MEVKTEQIIKSKLINKSEISRQIGISSPSVFTQKVNKINNNKLTDKNLSDIKKVFESEIKKAEIINIQELFIIFKLITNPENANQKDVLKEIIFAYENKYANIGLMEWYNYYICKK